MGPAGCSGCCGSAVLGRHSHTSSWAASPSCCVFKHLLFLSSSIKRFGFSLGSRSEHSSLFLVFIFSSHDFFSPEEKKKTNLPSLCVFSVVVSRRCRFSFLSHIFFLTGNESEIILFCPAQSTSFFFFLLFSSSPVRSSHAPQSLNRVWEKRETWGLKVRFYLMCRSPHLLSNVGFRLSSSAVSRRSTRLLRKSPLCFVSHGMFGCVWNLWCVFEPCRLFLYVCMALCSCAALLAWHICILVELIPPKKPAAWMSNPSLHYIQSQRLYGRDFQTFKKNCSEGFP